MTSIPEYPNDKSVSSRTAVIADGGTDSEAVDLSRVSTGLIAMPSGVAGANMTFKASRAQAGTYAVLQGITLTKAANDTWHEIPAAVMKAGWVKFVASGAVTGNQTIELILKT